MDLIKNTYASVKGFVFSLFDKIPGNKIVVSIAASAVVVVATMLVLGVLIGGAVAVLMGFITADYIKQS